MILVGMILVGDLLTRIIPTRIIPIQNHVYQNHPYFGSRFTKIAPQLFRVLAHPCLDIFQSDRLLPNMVSLKLNFHRASNNFCIMNVKTANTTKYKIRATRAIFHLKRSVLTPETFIRIERNLGSGANLLYI